MNSIPIARVKALKPDFIRDKHLGVVTKRQAIRRLDKDAAFARMGQVAASFRSDEQKKVKG